MKDYLQRFRAWWAGLDSRERRILVAGGGVLALMVLYLGVWEPLAQLRQNREEALAEARALAVRLEAMAADVQSNRGGGAAVVQGTNQSLLSVVDQSGKASGLGKTPSLRPEGENTVRVTVEDVPFDAVMRWLNELQSRYGVRVDNADIERESASGLVNVRVTLIR